MASNACWGVELGAGAVKAIKLVLDGENLKVADFAVLPHKKVLSTPDLDEADAKRVALGTLVAQHDLSKASLAVSVPGHSAFARFAKLPPVEASKIPDIVKFEAVQQIPFPIDDVQWDYETFTDPGSPDVEVGIFAITTEKVMTKLAQWQDVGRMPEVLTLSPLAAYNALAYDQDFGEQTPGTVILDIGTTSTDLIVADAGRLWIRTFPIGGHNFTEALVTNFNLSYSKAEKLKREAETTQHARTVLQAMRPIFQDLAQDVQRSMGYYQSTHREAKLTRLVGLGSTFHLPGLRKFLSQQLGIEVTRLEGFGKLKVEGDRGAEFSANAMNLATAYGLALQGLGLQTINANLMPVGVVREAMWREKTKWFIAGAAMFAVAGGAAFIGPMALHKPPTDAAPAVVNEVSTTAKRLKDEWERVNSQTQPKPEALALASLLDRRDVIPRITADMAELTGVLRAELGRGAPADAPPAVSRGTFVLKGFRTAFGRRAGDGLPMEPQPSADGTPEAPTVSISYQFLTTQPNDRVQRANAALAEWFRKNRSRNGVPYEYVIDDARLVSGVLPSVPSGSEEIGGIGAAPAPASNPGGGGAPGAGPGARPGGPGGPGAGGGGLGGGGAGLGGGGGAPPVDMGGGGGGGGGSGGAGAGTPGTLAELNMLAPLFYKPEDVLPVNTRAASYELQLKVRLKPISGAKEGGQ